MTVSFIVGGNRREPPTCSKSLTLSLNVVSSRPRLCRMLVVIGTDCIFSFNRTTIRSRLWWHRLFYIINQRFEQKITCNIQYLESKGSLLVVHVCHYMVIENTFLMTLHNVLKKTFKWILFVLVHWNNGLLVRHVDPLGHINLTPNQNVLALIP